MKTKNKIRTSSILRGRDASSKPRQRILPKQSKYLKARAVMYVTLLIGIVLFVATYAIASMLYDPTVPIPKGGWLSTVYEYKGLPVFPQLWLWSCVVILFACLVLAPIAGIYKPNE